MKKTLSLFTIHLSLFTLHLSLFTLHLSLFTLLAGEPPAPPVPLVWQFNGNSLSRRQYLKDVDFIKANTLVDTINVAPIDHVNPEDADQFHDAFKEMVEYAKKKGIRIALRHAPGFKGFFNASVDGGDAGTYVLDDPRDAQGIAYESEVVADAAGFASVTETAKWGRNKIRPLRNELLAVWSFERTADGFYRPDSLVDVTSRARIVARTSEMQTIEVDAGTAHAGRTFYVLTAQYFNSTDLFGGAMARFQRRIMDGLKDVPLAGYNFDEFGYMSLNVSGVSSGKAPPWRGRFYSAAQADWWKSERGVDLRRLLFDMRYAPAGNPAVRIRAINSYMDVMRRKPAEIERELVAYQKKLWGEDVFLACHSTFHNNLGHDEVWHTGCDWWEIPRDYGFTDEGIDGPTRMGILYGAKKPFLIEMYYSKQAEAYYREIVGLLPFNGREFHHAYNDDVWGKGFKDNDREFLANIRRFDAASKRLNAFQAKALPRMDVLVVFGMMAQLNWYPDAKARNKWDINGTLDIQGKGRALWSAGYRCALVPDALIESGRIALKDGTFVYNGHAFSHCLFLYPRYAKKCTWSFLNQAADAKMPLAVVGPADLDFDAEKVEFRGTRYDALSPEILAKMNCRKSAIPGGAVYEDGSFALVSRGIIDGKPTEFDFTLDGVHYKGHHTGVLAFRPGAPLVMTPGGALWADGKGVVASGKALPPMAEPCDGEGAAATPKGIVRDGEGAAATPEVARKMREEALKTMNGAEEIVFCTRPLCQSHLMYATFGENADEWEREVYPVLGSSIRRLNLKTGKETVILDDPRGNIRDVHTGYDGRKIIFGWRHVPETAKTHEERIKHVYHLFEMNADGTGLRQITDGPDDDFDPIYLPDGGILFGSGRCRRFIPCNRVRTSTLFRCDADGKNVLPLTSNVLLEDRPAVLPDGRIVYTRWDYVDRATETFRDLWVMNPDGSNQQLLWGGSDAARAYGEFHANCDAMPVPGRRQVVCTFSPAFGYRENAGKLHLVDLDKGPDDDAAKHAIGPDVSKDLGWSIGNGGMRCLKGFRDPYPFTDDCFLVCRGRSIQLVNQRGDCATVYTYAGKDTAIPHDARPLAPREKEPAIASRLDLSKTNGVFVLANVYEARNMKGVKPGTVKKLLIMEDLPKSASRHGPRGAHGGHISLHRVLGEVPVEADGSACFEVPALRAVMFAALDEKGIAVKRMQNFTQAMPGEVQGCVGCHETRTDASASARVLRERAGALIAMRRAPSVPKRPDGVPDVYVYTRDVQPVLDRNCVTCHSTEKAAGHVILTGDLTEWRSMSYDMLYSHLQISRATGWKENGNHGSYGFGTGASALMKKLDGSHHGVKVSPRDWDVMRLWVESSAHYSGTYGTHNHFESQVGATKNKTCHENGNVGGDWWFKSFDQPKLADELEGIAKRKCYSCHGNMYGLGRLRREQQDRNRWSPKGCPPEFLNSPNYSMTLFNMTHPEKSLFLAACMPRDQGGYGWCTNAQGQAIAAFSGPEDPDYVKVRTLIAEADARQRACGRLEYPGYRPQPYYCYWMKRFGILPPDFDIQKDPVDVFATDEKYWKSLHWTPRAAW